MSTRSNIGIRNEDDSLDIIYCHSDGYPGHNGKVLFEYYQDPAKVRALINLGDISYLAESIGEKHDFNWMAKVWGAGNYDALAKDPRSKMVLAYGRDRGETGIEADHYASVQDLEEQECASKHGLLNEYLYLFDIAQGKWFWMPTDRGTTLDGLAELTPQAWEKALAT